MIVGYVRAMAVRSAPPLLAVAFASTCAAALALPGRAEASQARRPAEVSLAVGPGSAACDDKKPESDCAVDGGVSFGLSGGWRFHRRFLIGLDLSGWSFKVRESWKGQLTSEATDVRLSSSYLSTLARWYFVASGPTDAYVQLGVGGGTVSGHAENASGTYDFAAKGVVVPAAIGAEWHVLPNLRLGVQALAYLHLSSRVCDTGTGSEQCRDAGADSNALPWRIALVASVPFGAPLR